MATPHVRLHFPVSKSPLVPFNSTMCPRNGPKRRQKAPKSAQCAPSPPKPSTGCILCYVAQNSIQRTPSPPATPHFSWTRNRLNGRLDTHTSGHLVVPEGSPARARWGPKVGPVHQCPRGEKCFFKVVPRPLGMLKSVFLAYLEAVVARFGPCKIPKCLENGPFWDQKCVEIGSKTHFSKNDPEPFMMLKQVFIAHFEPVVTRFGPWEIPKCLENVSFWDQKWVENGSKTRFPKSDLGPFGMLKQVFLAHFEPVVTRFGPWKIPKSLENGSFWEQKGS